ncbi:MAG: alpha/beta hydrolase [Pseudomonadota bacterium]
MVRKLLGGILAITLIGAAALGLISWQTAQSNAAASLALTQSADQFVEVDGLTVRVRDEGPRDAPVLIMLHGFTFSLESFDQLTEDLQADYRIIRYDLRGHGLTGPDPQKRYAPEQRAAHIGAVMDQLGIQRATLVGNSLGGLASWRFAADNPERLEKLILISPGAYPINGVTEEPAPVPPALEAYFRFLPESGIDMSIDRIFADANAIGDERKASIKAMMRAPGNGQAFIDALKVFTLPDPEPDLARVVSPTLIIWGDADVVISPKDGEKMRSAMPDAELLLLPSIGHVAHEEAPQRVADAIREFLDGERDES